MPPTQDTQYAYVASITKADEQPDGTLMVYGKVTGPDLDMDQQRMEPTWLKTAMPKWFEWGNIREQHGAIAAGVGVALEEKGDDWYLKAHIVDPGTVLKVKNRVLKGFSVGIKHGKILKTVHAPNGLICKGDVVEVSLVDRPSNPTCAIDIAKSAGGLGDELMPAFLGDDEAAEPDAIPEDDSQPVDEPVEKSADADAVTEDELETVGDLRKGFVMDLLRGKNDKPKGHGPDKHNRDDAGKFAAANAAAKAKMDRAKAKTAQEAANRTSDAQHAEALRDAEHARLAGRGEEAAHHLTTAASHARNNAQRHRVRQERSLTAASLVREKSVAPDAVLDWCTDVEDILGADEGVLDVTAYKAALATLRQIDDGVIVKRHDEQADIDGANEVIAKIADLIISEATELKNGCPEEIDDIMLLVEACRTLYRFCRNEKRQEMMGTGSDADMMTYAAEPDITKRAKALGLESTLPEDWTKAASADSDDGATLVDAGVINKAVTEATAPLKAELTTLREALARVESTPIPGGAFVMSTAPVTKAATASGPTRADYLRTEAAKISDPAVQAAYRRAAREAEGAPV